MTDEQITPAEPTRTNIGGRYGSPTVTVAFPFSNVVNTDTELRGIVEELIRIVEGLASATSDDERRAAADASRELLDRIAPGD